MSDKTNSKALDPEILKAIDAWYWAIYSGIRLASGPFTMQNHLYQVEPMQSRAQCRVYKKAAQMGFTETEVLRTLHDLIYGYFVQGVLYLFPIRCDVTDFSKARFTPLINENLAIGAHVKDTDAANIKAIGNAMLYFRGARSTYTVEGVKKDSPALRSIPVDKIVYDEKDLMDHEMVTQAHERMSHSTVQEEVSISTPTIPEYGIDRDYSESSQAVWMIKCQHCGKETCLELEFPNSVIRRGDGTAYCACIHCKEEVFPWDGYWVHRFPDNPVKGWWISQLNSAYVKPEIILNLYENPPQGNLTEIMNSKLGMAHISAENRVTTNDVYAICGNDPMPSKHIGPCAMGVDVGTMLHVVIGFRPSDFGIQGAYFARVSDFNDVHDIAKRFNVESAVIEMEPEMRKAREFQEVEPYEVWLFDYQERQRHSPNFDSPSGVVTMNRTELCDATHDLVTKPGRYTLPRRNAEIEQYAYEMSNIVKVLEEDKITGSRSYKYRKLAADRPDHYRHATNFMLLAAQRVGVCDPEHEKNRPKDKWGNWQDDDRPRGGFMGS